MELSDGAFEGAKQVWSEAIRLLAAAWPEALAYFAVTVTVWTLIDLQVLGDGLLVPAMIVDFVLAYLLTIGLLTKGGLAPGGLRGTIGGYFLVSLISGLAISFGFILLIVPGVILLVRWLPAYGVVLADGEPGTEALSKSWEATSGKFWPLLVAIFAPMTLLAIPFFTLFYYDLLSIFVDEFSEDYVETPAIYLVVTTMLSGLGSLAVTAIGIASYSLLRDDSASLNKVFE